jgi:hypothetical protein
MYFVDADSDDLGPKYKRQFSENYNIGIQILSGDEDRIRYAAKALRAYYKKVTAEDGSISFDHTTFMYIFSADGAFEGFTTNVSQLPSLIYKIIGADAARRLQRRGALFFQTAHAEDALPHVEGLPDLLDLAPDFERAKARRRLPNC